MQSGRTRRSSPLRIEEEPGFVRNSNDRGTIAGKLSVSISRRMSPSPSPPPLPGGRKNGRKNRFSFPFSPMQQQIHNTNEPQARPLDFKPTFSSSSSETEKGLKNSSFSVGSAKRRQHAKLLTQAYNSSNKSSDQVQEKNENSSFFKPSPTPKPFQTPQSNTSIPPNPTNFDSSNSHNSSAKPLRNQFQLRQHDDLSISSSLEATIPPYTVSKSHSGNMNNNKLRTPNSASTVVSDSSLNSRSSNTSSAAERRRLRRIHQQQQMDSVKMFPKTSPSSKHLFQYMEVSDSANLNEENASSFFTPLPITHSRSSSPFLHSSNSNKTNLRPPLPPNQLHQSPPLSFQPNPSSQRHQSSSSSSSQWTFDAFGISKEIDDEVTHAIEELASKHPDDMKNLGFQASRELNSFFVFDDNLPSTPHSQASQVSLHQSNQFHFDTNFPNSFFPNKQPTPILQETTFTEDNNTHVEQWVPPSSTATKEENDDSQRTTIYHRNNRTTLHIKTTSSPTPFADEYLHSDSSSLTSSHEHHNQQLQSHGSLPQHQQVHHQEDHKQNKSRQAEIKNSHNNLDSNPFQTPQTFNNRRNIWEGKSQHNTTFRSKKINAVQQNDISQNNIKSFLSQNSKLPNQESISHSSSRNCATSNHMKINDSGPNQSNSSELHSVLNHASTKFGNTDKSSSKNVDFDNNKRKEEFSIKNNSLYAKDEKSGTSRNILKSSTPTAEAKAETKDEAEASHEFNKLKQSFEKNNSVQNLAYKNSPNKAQRRPYSLYDQNSAQKSQEIYAHSYSTDMEVTHQSKDNAQQQPKRRWSLQKNQNFSQVAEQEKEARFSPLQSFTSNAKDDVAVSKNHLNLAKNNLKQVQERNPLEREVQSDVNYESKVTSQHVHRLASTFLSASKSFEPRTKITAEYEAPTTKSDVSYGSKFNKIFQSADTKRKITENLREEKNLSASTSNKRPQTPPTSNSKPLSCENKSKDVNNEKSADSSTQRKNIHKMKSFIQQQPVVNYDELQVVRENLNKGIEPLNQRVKAQASPDENKSNPFLSGVKLRKTGSTFLAPEIDKQKNNRVTIEKEPEKVLEVQASHLDVNINSNLHDSAKNDYKDSHNSENETATACAPSQESAKPRDVAQLIKDRIAKTRANQSKQEIRVMEECSTPKEDFNAMKAKLRSVRNPSPLKQKALNSNGTYAQEKIVKYKQMEELEAVENPTKDNEGSMLKGSSLNSPGKIFKFTSPPTQDINMNSVTQSSHIQQFLPHHEHSQNMRQEFSQRSSASNDKKVSRDVESESREVLEFELSENRYSAKESSSPEGLTRNSHAISEMNDVPSPNSKEISRASNNATSSVKPDTSKIEALFAARAGTKSNDSRNDKNSPSTPLPRPAHEHIVDNSKSTNDISVDDQSNSGSVAALMKMKAKQLKKAGPEVGHDPKNVSSSNFSTKVPTALAEPSILNNTSSKTLKDDPVYSKYFKMLKMGLPMEVVKHAMTRDGLDPDVMDGNPNEPVGVPLKDDPEFEKYFKMLKMGLPKEVVKHAMTRDGLDPSIIDGDPNLPVGSKKNASKSGEKGTKFGVEKSKTSVNDGFRRTRLHWDTLGSVSKKSVWSLVQRDPDVEKIDIDENEFKQLFQAESKPLHRKNRSCEAGTDDPRFNSSESTKTGVNGPGGGGIYLGGNGNNLLKKYGAVVKVIDPKRANNGGIILARVKISFDAIAQAVNDMDENAISQQHLQRILEFLPSSKEAKALNEYVNEESNTLERKKARIESLCECEKFMVAMMNVKHVKSKIRSLIFQLQFDNCIKELEHDAVMVEHACEELSNSVRLRKLLGIVLNIGNRLNTAGHTSKAGAAAFTVQSLLKLNQAKAFDKKTTFLHYVVLVVMRNNNDLIEFKNDLPSVPKADKIFWDQCLDELEEVENQLENVRMLALHQASLISHARWAKSYKASLAKYTSEADDQSLRRTSEYFTNKTGTEQVSLSLTEEVEALRSTAIGRFALDAIKVVSTLRDRVEKTNNSFSRLLEYFGEDVKSKMQPHELFQIIVQFCKNFDLAKIEVIANEKVKARQAKAKSQTLAPSTNASKAQSEHSVNNNYNHRNIQKTQTKMLRISSMQPDFGSLQRIKKAVDDKPHGLKDVGTKISSKNGHTHRNEVKNSIVAPVANAKERNTTQSPKKSSLSYQKNIKYTDANISLMNGAVAHAKERNIKQSPKSSSLSYESNITHVDTKMSPKNNEATYSNDIKKRTVAPAPNSRERNIHQSPKRSYLSNESTTAKATEKVEKPRSTIEKNQTDISPTSNQFNKSMSMRQKVKMRRQREQMYRASPPNLNSCNGNSYIVKHSIKGSKGAEDRDINQIKHNPSSSPRSPSFRNNVRQNQMKLNVKNT